MFVFLGDALQMADPVRPARGQLDRQPVHREVHESFHDDQTHGQACGQSQETQGFLSVS